MGALYCGTVYGLPKVACRLFGGPGVPGQAFVIPSGWLLLLVSLDAFHLGPIVPRHNVMTLLRSLRNLSDGSPKLGLGAFRRFHM